jgi:NAD(P)-dependent dehydrogenase (short-subunit alcohol dehydrogenase family)
MLERFRLDGEVAVITGGGNGIGRATAAAFVEAGAAVALLDRDEKAVKETETTLRAAGAEVEAYTLDVTDEIALETSFAGVNRRWGRLDILVNNAGISIRHPTVELSLADWNNVVAVNMTGVFLGSRAAARYMLPKRKGSIVNTASIMGLSGGGLYPNVSYQATKGGIVNMTRALAVEWAGWGIRVNAVAPNLGQDPVHQRLHGAAGTHGPNCRRNATRPPCRAGRSGRRDSLSGKSSCIHDHWPYSRCGWWLSRSVR